MTVNEIIDWFESQRSETNIAGKKRYGIESELIFGVQNKQIDVIRRIIKKDHALALELWQTGYHELRHLASLIADPKIIDEETIYAWAHDFDNWAICDSVCSKLFQKTDFVYQKIDQWVLSDQLYVKRAAFTLIAAIAVHHKKLPDSFFNQYFQLIIENANDERNYIKKAVNWALRQIGKRNKNLASEAVKVCYILREVHNNSKSARWIATDAERELRQKFDLSD